MNFALHYGTTSSPPLHIYYTECVQEQLKSAAKYFLRKYVKIDKNNITLPKILEWYSNDFGNTKIEVLEKIRSIGSIKELAHYQSIDLERINIKYSSYQWDFGYILNNPEQEEETMHSILKSPELRKDLVSNLPFVNIKRLNVTDFSVNVNGNITNKINNKKIQ